jgi:pimeloyl-ACP methyl ester carboxylesterase
VAQWGPCLTLELLAFRLMPMAPTLFNSRLQLSQGHVFWRETGRGEPLVFLHGSWGDGDQWQSLVPYLCDSHRCVVPDLLGFGNSTLAYSSVTTQVEWLDAYFDKLRLEEVTLVAHSLGAWVAASYALVHSDRVKRLVLIAPEGISVPGFQWTWERRLADKDSLWAKILIWMMPIANLIGKGPRVQQLLAQREVLLQFPATCRLLFSRNPREIAAEMIDELLPEMLPPVMLLQGFGEGDRGRALTARFETLCPTAQVRAVPGVLRDSLENPEAWAAVIREFMAAPVPPRPVPTPQWELEYVEDAGEVAGEVTAIEETD